MSAVSILEALIRREIESRTIQERLCETTPWDSVERAVAAVRKQKHTATVNVLTEALNAIEAEARNA